MMTAWRVGNRTHDALLVIQKDSGLFPYHTQWIDEPVCCFQITRDAVKVAIEDADVVQKEENEGQILFNNNRMQ